MAISPPPIAAKIVVVNEFSSKIETAVPRTYSVAFKVVAVGVALFLIGAIGILIYFSTHPVRYQSSGLESFELKSILAEELEIIAPQPPAIQDQIATVKPSNRSEKAVVKNNAIEAYILSIQPKKSGDNKSVVHEVGVEKNRGSHKVELKKEPTLSNLHSTAQKAGISKPIETLEKNNDNLLIKLIDGITKHGVTEPTCTDPMRALNQCR